GDVAARASPCTAAVRTYLGAIMTTGTKTARRRVRAPLTVTLAVALAGAAGAGALGAQEGGAPVYRVPVTGTVELGLAPFIERSLDEARDAGARFVVLDIDTPGGRVDAAERIADALRDSEVPVYALVNRRACSAGALIALATDGIFMRPG